MTSDQFGLCVLVAGIIVATVGPYMAFHDNSPAHRLLDRMDARAIERHRRRKDQR